MLIWHPRAAAKHDTILLPAPKLVTWTNSQHYDALNANVCLVLATVRPGYARTVLVLLLYAYISRDFESKEGPSMSVTSRGTR
jgi:hypothetical protein